MDVLIKTCTKCLIGKPIEQFGKAKAYRNGRRSWCKQCCIVSNGHYNKLNIDKYRARKRAWNHTRKGFASALKVRYGLSLEQFDEMVLRQCGRCAICDAPELLRPDHDHLTGAVRGLLCNRCNTGLGLFRDSPVFLMSAIQHISM